MDGNTPGLQYAARLFQYPVDLDYMFQHVGRKDHVEAVIIERKVHPVVVDDGVCADTRVVTAGKIYRCDLVACICKHPRLLTGARAEFEYARLGKCFSIGEGRHRLREFVRSQGLNVSQVALVGHGMGSCAMDANPDNLAPKGSTY